MSLVKGDHLRIQRNGKLVEPESEAYHEFEAIGSLKDGEVLDYVSAERDADGVSYYDVRIKVIK